MRRSAVVSRLLRGLQRPDGGGQLPSLSFWVRALQSLVFEPSGGAVDLLSPGAERLLPLLGVLALGRRQRSVFDLGICPRAAIFEGDLELSYLLWRLITSSIWAPSPALRVRVSTLFELLDYTHWLLSRDRGGLRGVSVAKIEI
jgi:hypothetical protein